MASQLNRPHVVLDQLDVRVGEAQAEIKGAIHSLQIDNQLVTATKPVVLSPNARNIRSSSALDMTMQPMIKFTVSETMFLPLLPRVPRR